MMTPSRSHAKKLRDIRTAEGITQADFAKMLEIGIGTVRNYESGHREAGMGIIDKVVNHPRFTKYTLWLMTGQTLPNAGQVCPAESADESNQSARSA
ncbi:MULTISPECIES: helix-turn-helix domain-containing protein [Lelliottia]|uniref:Helix-turn-helix transcriptional regulator n=1 Tax=Lelliottia amnigena TaxID=61646 RepID=A0AAP2AI03_LELAM|nr:MULTISPECIES: helix-turn-helix transcriptional regulator [Lelliottia]MBL5884837.1 helix-turn-helix transcriptional regulator [Lelliottia aquatilis]MBL5901163.1 helix-turn-helix transcriptional regulator [Lelliottia amnigena]MBL5936995.1 helix-turn-helix transcriptional regulator [Lelliottia amnigena]